ncbi:Salicylate hydroxylase [Psilocybe cubensis]|uniref:Salicylate hydroxylase n=1 Tax=Psilocybe cubensis TaxID=181762 RepID=A0ACB8GV64_PSICU|nr:Salicylate hydroxylase [Psilocybe cubensis]KAH9479528.1 Salicylate hydroxylase [Psilocybe cubensis]
MPQPLKDFTVAIVGGGMCGLACAYGFANAGIKADVFEAAAHYHEIGAGVGFGHNAIRVLRELGLFDTILKVSGQQKANQRLFNMISGTGDHEQVFDYAESSGQQGNEGLGVYRPVFLDAVMPLLDPTMISTHFNKRCVSVEQSNTGPQTLHFADGTTHEADVIIGADGIKSVTRSAIVSETDNRLAFSGTYAYRGLIPIDLLETEGIKADIRSRPHCWVGAGKARKRHGGDKMLTSEHSHPWVESVPQAEVLNRFSGWGNDVMIMLNHLKQPSRWSIHTLYPPLDSYVNGRVVLIGDAAHAMVPHLGAGVGQGFEDTYALCRLLGHPNVRKANIETALKIYNEIRPPRANMVLKRSLRAGKIYESYGPGLYDISKMRHNLMGIWEPVWRFDLMDQVGLAILKEFEDSPQSVEKQKNPSTTKR